MPYYDLKRWASITNCLPLAVIEYLRSDPAKRKLLPPSRKVSAAQAVKGVRNELRRTPRARAVVVEKQGEEYRLVPPKAYLEAKKTVRESGVRPQLEV